MLFGGGEGFRKNVTYKALCAAINRHRPSLEGPLLVGAAVSGTIGKDDGCSVVIRSLKALVGVISWLEVEGTRKERSLSRGAHKERRYECGGNKGDHRGDLKERN